MKRSVSLTLLRLALGVFLGVVAARAAEWEKDANPRANTGLSAALADARRLATRHGDQVLRVEGRSMLPYFGDGSILVVRAAPVEELRAGMVVVYRNRFGETVAHRLEARSSAGWIARGANNTDADSTPVTAENLVGAVYVTIYSDPRATEETPVLAQRGIAPVTVALAAPAR